MILTIKVKCDNQSLVDGQIRELREILSKALEFPDWELIENLHGKKLRDSNGNQVGFIGVTNAN